MSKLEEYMEISDEYQVPETMNALVLSGAGKENLNLETVQVPRCGDNELLARV